MKYTLNFLKMYKVTSLPVWGAWIEIRTTDEKKIWDDVAPRVGGVD